MSEITLIDETWVQAHAADRHLVFIDARPAAAFRQGHLPGARHLEPSLLALAKTDAASIEVFHTRLAWIFSASGISIDDELVIYGAATEVNIYRVAWAAEYSGIQNIHILDGGLALAPGLPLTTELPPVRPTRFELRPARGAISSADEVLASLDSPGVRVVDAREHAEYAGSQSNASRFGRIPGAIHWDTAHEIADARLRSAAELAERFASQGLHADDKLIVYCGGGGRAARTFVALRAAGYRNASVYPASWGEWGNRADLPLDEARSASPA